MNRHSIAFAVGLGVLAALVNAAEHRVNAADDESLRRAINDAQAGRRIVIAPGKYRPGIYARNLHGTADQPIIIEGADAANKPLFVGGGEALHFSDCTYLTLRNIAVRGQSGNGINIDDGGSFDTPAHHITLESIDVAETGPRGNRDPIKLSGVDDLLVRGCTFEGWGGQAIDMVGCHRGLIEECTFRGKPGFSQDSGPQTKGGSSDITIRNCTFHNAGQRGVNIGGSTSLRVFRPQGAKYEAKNIIVEGCRFVGGHAPVAYVGVDGATVRYNTIYHPQRWVLRILQETTEPGFIACRDGRFERNLIVYRRSEASIPVNIGPNTNPATFLFRENYWYCEDRPDRSRPELPTREEGGMTGINPRIEISGEIPSLPSAAEAKSFGADALVRP